MFEPPHLFGKWVLHHWNGIDQGIIFSLTFFLSSPFFFLFMKIQGGGGKFFLKIYTPPKKQNKKKQANVKFISFRSKEPSPFRMPALRIASGSATPG